jgi:hypothetical protein
VSPFRDLSGIYGPEELALFQQAYDEACRDLKLDPAAVSDSRAKQIREKVATAVLEAARLGERDPAALKAYAVATAMGRAARPKK